MKKTLLAVSVLLLLVSSASAEWDFPNLTLQTVYADLKTAVERNQAVSKVLEVLLSVQNDALSMQVLFSELIRPNLPDYNNPFTFVRPL